MQNPLVVSPQTDNPFMARALELAVQGGQLGEIPVGAVVAWQGQIIAEAFNEKEATNNPLAHAEILAIERASQKLNRWRLSGCTLYVTLEPCLMCAGAIVQARVDRVVFATPDPKTGAVESIYQVLKDSRLNHQPLLTRGVLEQECSTLLKNFFRVLREQKKNSSPKGSAPV